ncbi:hypothetical protein PICSAR26_04623 [Mycobacterium avium subsp. paratuberculosis]|nr:hypothetical protein PICSAR26_04623 [Mycobacterium avium subsp. paratuberculosis]
MRVRLPGQGRRGQAQRVDGVRRRGGGVPDGGAARASGQLLQRLGPAGHRDRRRLEARPVRQPGGPGQPLRHHRPGDLGRHRRQGHPFRRRHRHRRHHHRRGPLPQGGVRRPGPRHRRRPRGIGVFRRHRPALSGRGRRRGLLAAGLRPHGARRDHRGLRLRLVQHDPAAGPRGGDAGRRVLRHGRGGGAAGGRAGRARRAGGGAAARRRARLHGEDLQRRLDVLLRVPAYPAGRVDRPVPRRRRVAPQVR